MIELDELNEAIVKPMETILGRMKDKYAEPDPAPVVGSDEHEERQRLDAIHLKLDVARDKLIADSNEWWELQGRRETPPGDEPVGPLPILVMAAGMLIGVIAVFCLGMIAGIAIW